MTNSGTVLEFQNWCYAECAGYCDYVACDTACICPEIYDPVCATGPNGNILQFDNACFAICYGFEHFVACDSTCICPDVWDPVCVMTNSGNLIQFENACVAECEGYTDYLPCTVDCGCPDIYKPVCVLTNNGEMLTFSNGCEAECAGYKNFFPCNHPDIGVPTQGESALLQAFPNPSGGNFNIISGLPDGLQITYQLIDIHGQVILEQTTQNTRIEVRNQDFVPGLYFIRAFNRTDTRSGRMIIE
jgi:hypothetical protein